MTGWRVWLNRVYWVVCGGLLLLTAGLAGERHLRRLTAEALNPALTQVSEEISGLNHTADDLRSQIAALESRVASASPTTSPVTVTKTAAADRSGSTRPAAAVDNPIAAAAASSTTEAVSSTAAVVNINQSSREELMTLPGIGSTYADRIIAGRPYASVDELTRVKGIGEKTLQKLRSRVEI